MSFGLLVKRILTWRIQPYVNGSGEVVALVYRAELVCVVVFLVGALARSDATDVKLDAVAHLGGRTCANGVKQFVHR